MTQAAFIDLIRQFRSAAQRKRRSYARGVNAVLGMWRETVNASALSAEDKRRQLEWADAAVMREYAPSDAEYDLPAVG